jgi:hypothetical protein
VPHREDQAVVAVKLVVHHVGETTKAAATGLAVHTRPDFRRPFDLRDADLETVEEGSAEGPRIPNVPLP